VVVQVPQAWLPEVVLKVPVPQAVQVRSAVTVHGASCVNPASQVRQVLHS
jgi:hypothetical protein